MPTVTDEVAIAMAEDRRRAGRGDRRTRPEGSLEFRAEAMADPCTAVAEVEQAAPEIAVAAADVPMSHLKKPCPLPMPKCWSRRRRTCGRSVGARQLRVLCPLRSPLAPRPPRRRWRPRHPLKRRPGG